MHACVESTRRMFRRLRRAIVAIALICIAPSAFATATGTMTKTFDNNVAQTVALGGETLMRLYVSITYSPGNGNILIITDTLPAGMEVAPAADQPQMPSTCDPAHSTLSIVPGSHSVSYNYWNATAHNLVFSCHLYVKLKAVKIGVWQNTASASAGSDNGGGPGISLNASATLTVTGPPTLTRGLSGFVSGTTDGTSWAIPGQPLALHYTLTNPNPALTLTGVGFNEIFPSGLIPLGGIIDNTCYDGSGSGNTVTASSGGIVASGIQLAGGASCVIDVGITANNAGTYTLGAIAPTSNPEGAGAAVAASTFLAFDPPHVWMVTTPASGAIDLDSSGTMTLVLESASAVDVGGMAFSATLPPGLTVADSSTSQCGGTATASAVTGQLTLTGATVPSNGVCNVGFTVTGTQVGDRYVEGVVTVHGALLRDNFGTYFTVNPLTTTTTLAATPATAVHGQNVTFTAVVSLPGGSSRAAVGTVAFTENGNPLPDGCANAAIVSGGLASCTTSALTTATHHVVSTFAPGDGNTKTSMGVTDITVGKATTTTTISNAQPWTITLGASVTVSVTVATSAPGSGIPVGAVTVSDGAGAQCVIGALASGSGSCMLTPTSAGMKSVTATYAPDAASATNFAASAASASLTVNPSQPGATLASSANPSVFGQAVTVTGTLTPATGGVSPSGAVHFYVDGTEICANAALIPVGATKAVSATCAIPQAKQGVGDHLMRFEYAGDSNNMAANASLAQTVSVAQTTTTLTVPPSAVLGDPVTIGVAVSARAPGAGIPAGDVAISIGSQVCHATLDATGAGSCALTPQAPAGNRTVAADYAGTTSFAASSGTASLQVGASSTTTMLSAPPTAVHGESVTFTATVSPPNGNAGAANGTVAFTENGNPLPGGCANTVAVSGGSASCTTLSLSTATHHVVATFTPGDGNTKTSTGGTDIAVGKAATTTTISNAQPWTITFGAAATVNVTVATNAPGFGTPSGTVTMSDGDMGSGDQCTITLPATSCVLTPSGAGTKTLTATFTPDTPASINFAGSSATATLTVARAAQATLNLVATPDVLIPGMTSQLAASGGSGSGAIAYDVDSGPCSVSGSIATATGVGICVVRATKAADANYDAADATATLVVQAAVPPTAHPRSVTVAFNTARTIQLVGDDINPGGPYAVTYAIVDAPLHGTLAGFDASSGALTYTPAVGYVGADRFTFTVSSVNGVSQAATVTLTVAAPQLVLSIADGRDFVRYGQIVDYTVTLTNAGDAANAVPVTFALSAGFDANAVTLTCTGATNGATCVQDTTNPLHFTVTLPPGRTLTWLVGAPVRNDAAGDTVTFGVDAIGASSVVDTNMLVVFRDGFDAADGDGSRIAPVVAGASAQAVLDGDAVFDVAVPSSIGAWPTPWLTVRDAAREVRVEGVNVFDVVFVRLFEHRVDGDERVSPWSAIQPGATLTLGSVAVSDASPADIVPPPRAVVLGGAEAAVALP